MAWVRLHAVIKGSEDRFREGEDGAFGVGRCISCRDGRWCSDLQSLPYLYHVVMIGRIQGPLCSPVGQGWLGVLQSWSQSS
jgi:hypothetical protein